MERKDRKNKTSTDDATESAHLPSMESEVLKALDEDQPAISKRKQQDLKKENQDEKMSGGFDDWSVSWP